MENRCFSNLLLVLTTYNLDIMHINSLVNWAIAHDSFVTLLLLSKTSHFPLPHFHRIRLVGWIHSCWIFLGVSCIKKSVENTSFKSEYGEKRKVFKCKIHFKNAKHDFKNRSYITFFIFCNEDSFSAQNFFFIINVGIGRKSLVQKKLTWKLYNHPIKHFKILHFIYEVYTLWFYIIWLKIALYFELKVPL